MDGFKRFTDIVFILGIIILLICGGIAGYLTHKSELKITSCRSTAAGTVVSVGKAIDIGKGFGFTKYTAEYTVDGQTYYATGANMYDTRAGDRVEVRYDHFDPEVSYIGNYPSEKAYGSLVMRTGLGLFLLSLIGKFNFRRRFFRSSV